MTKTERIAAAREALRALADYRAHADLLASEKDHLKDSVITDEQRAELAAIDLEYADREDSIAQAIREQEESVRQLVLTVGESVADAGLRAEYRKPRVTWDNAKLEGFATVYPDILDFRHTGAASVAIKVTK